MPKKFVGENSKATVARQRKEASKEAEKQKKQKELEDAYWEDDDKKAKKRQSKKDEIEKKKQEQLNKKAEAKELLEKEMSSINKVVKVVPPPKITRAQIQTDNEKRVAAVKKVTEVTKPTETHIEKPLEENLNRALPEEVASTIDEAIAMLTDTKVSSDKHPEKRMKAAYTAFEEKYLPIYKQENPTLRMSQLKQMIFKEWQKSSENPLNKPT